jgi:ribosomal protein L22
MTEQDPKDTERAEPEAEATDAVTPAPPDEHEPGAAAEAAEKAQGEDAAATDDAPAADDDAPAAEAKPKPKRRRKKAEPAAEAAAEPEATEADAPAEAEPAEEAKPKRTRRKKAEPVAEAEEPAAETEAPAAEEAAEEEPEAEEAVEEQPPAPKPVPKRKPLGVDGAPVIVRAQAKYVRSSARKARLVSDQIRGKSVQDARAILATTPRAVARDWTKLLESAIANAENNHELVGEDLRISRVHADEGPTLKRFRPRAMGRATKIRKRTSHLTILLSPKE